MTEFLSQKGCQEAALGFGNQKITEVAATPCFLSPGPNHCVHEPRAGKDSPSHPAVSLSPQHRGPDVLCVIFLSSQNLFLLLKKGIFSHSLLS